MPSIKEHMVGHKPALVACGEHHHSCRVYELRMQTKLRMQARTFWLVFLGFLSLTWLIRLSLSLGRHMCTLQDQECLYYIGIPLRDTAVQPSAIPSVLGDPRPPFENALNQGGAVCPPMRCPSIMFDPRHS